MTFINEAVLHLMARLQAAKNEEGATMVEYGLMVALIAAVCIAVVTTLGTNVQGKFQQVATAIG